MMDFWAGCVNQHSIFSGFRLPKTSKKIATEEGLATPKDGKFHLNISETRLYLGSATYNKKTPHKHRGNSKATPN